MTELTLIPGVVYEVSVDVDRQHWNLLLYAPFFDGDPSPWWFEEAQTWIGLAPTDTNQPTIREVYNPHGKPKVETLWGVKPDWDDADEEDITYAEGLGYGYDYAPYTKQDAYDRARELGGTVVTRTITTTTITHATEWTEVTE